MSYTFELEKRKAAWNLLRELETGKVDPDIIELLSIINYHPDYYTTSSCSGRIQVSASETPGEKGIMVVVAKWHRPIEKYELDKVTRYAKYPSLWLSVQGPIMHIVCRTLDAAQFLLITARNSGLKHSGIQGVGKRAVVEIVSSDRIEMPLKLSGVDCINPHVLAYLIDKVNTVLLRSKARLSTFCVKLAHQAKSV
ncbi:MAG: hypothetical protein QXY49_03185 [Thermofilaceae archaeon]